MCRNFDVQVEVFPCTAEQRPAIVAVLARWGMAIEGECESYDDNYPDDGWCFWGAISLTTTEHEAHDQLVAHLPELVVITRWRCVDDLPWDEELTTEPSSISPAA
jgi:hypothetical protein